jgi:DNA mismatch endonuclease (patch repair protein)
MADTLSPSERSDRMRRIKGKDTSPELAVRKLAFAAGYRYRLHAKGLPGRPDLVFPRLKLTLFVHGCFWHGHEGCKTAHVPKTRSEYWKSKFLTNQLRDCRVQRELQEAGWSVLVVWECETKDRVKLGRWLSRKLVRADKAQRKLAAGLSAKR